MERNYMEMASNNSIASISNIIDDFNYITELERLRVAGSVVQCSRVDNDTFLTLMDQSGEIKIWLNSNYIGNKMYSRLLQVDIGDILRIDGARFMTKAGEMSIKADSMQLLSRANRYLTA
jgi:lysyl-tRNA synthetase, class II